MLPRLHRPLKTSHNTSATDGFTPYRVRMRRAPHAHRPRVLHVIANFYTGGSSQLVVDLVEHLGHRFEQAVVARDLPPAPAYTGIQLRHVPAFDSVEQASTFIDTYRPDFLHVHFLGHHGNSYSEMDWQWYDKIFKAAERDKYAVLENLNIPVEPYVSEAVSCYVHVSDFVRRNYAVPEGRNVTVYPGSDLTLFSRTRVEDVPDDCIGMVYRLEKDKLNEQAIEVFINVVGRRPQTRVLIVGGGRYLDHYRRRVDEAGVAGAFTFTGYVGYRDLPALYEKLSVFVAPVHWESFGQVSPFAMGMCLPVAGYRIGALEEITGDAALLAPPGDIDKLAEIVTELLDDREHRLRIGAANRRRVRELFSLEAMIERYASLYDFMTGKAGDVDAIDHQPADRARA